MAPELLKPLLAEEGRMEDAVRGAAGTDKGGALGCARLNTATPSGCCTKTNAGQLLITADRVMLDGRERLMECTSQSTDNLTAEIGVV